jgi:hypothetical protein
MDGGITKPGKKPKTEDQRQRNRKYEKRKGEAGTLPDGIYGRWTADTGWASRTA